MTHKRRIVVELEISGGTTTAADRICDGLGPSLGPWLRDALTQAALAHPDTAMIDFKVSRDATNPYAPGALGQSVDLFGWHRHDPGR